MGSTIVNRTTRLEAKSVGSSHLLWAQSEGRFAMVAGLAAELVAVDSDTFAAC